MEKVKVDVKNRSNGSAIIEILLGNDKLYRIEAGGEVISVSTIDGGMIINPKASNFVIITTDKN